MSAEMERAGAARTTAARVAAVLLFGTLAGAIYTYPLVLHFSKAIPYTFGVPPQRQLEGLIPGDHLQFYYALSLSVDWFRGDAPWFRDPYQFSAPEPPKRRTFFFLPFSLLFAAVAMPLGATVAYNLLLLLSFPATALSVFLLATRFDLDWRGAAVAAAAVTLLPYRIASLADGHPTGVSFFLLPLALYFLERAWQQTSLAAAAGGGLTLLVLGLNEPHFLYFFAFLLPLWLAFAVWRLEPARHAEDLPASLALLALSAAGPAIAFAFYSTRHGRVSWQPQTALLLFLAFWAVVAVAWRFSAEIRARAGNRAWKAEAASYLPLLVFAAYSVQGAVDVPHLGGLLFVVAVLGLASLKLPLLRALGRLSRAPAYRAAVNRLGVLWPLAVGFAAAVFLLLRYKSSNIDASAHFEGRALREIVLFSPRLGDFFRRANGSLNHELYPGTVVALLALFGLVTPVGRAMVLAAVAFAVLALGPGAPHWLPLYPIVYRVVPFFDLIRQPAKLFAITAVLLGLAAGLGMSVFYRRSARPLKPWIFALGLTAILLDLSLVLPLGLSKLPAGNHAYAVIAERARGSNLLELPLWPGDSAYSSIYQYWVTRTKVPIVNGYSAITARDYVERVARALESMNAGELSEEQSRRLDELRVRYVTLHRDTYPPKVNLYPYRFALTAMRKDPNLGFVTEDEGVYLFERATPYRPWDPLIGWPIGTLYEAESLLLGVGQRVDDPGASGGVLVRGMPSPRPKLPVMYGPYRVSPRGRYEVRFRARGRGTVDVATDSGRRILGSAEVDTAEWSELPVTFAIDRPTPLEWRAWSDSTGDRVLDVDWALISKLDPLEPGAPADRFEAENLNPVHGIDLESPDASGGAYVVLLGYPPMRSVDRDGPYRLFDPGRLRLTVRSRRGALGVQVESADGRRRFAEVEIPEAPSWATTEMDFDLPEREILCARLVFVGVQADVDYVELANIAR